MTGRPGSLWCHPNAAPESSPTLDSRGFQGTLQGEWVCQGDETRGCARALAARSSGGSRARAGCSATWRSSLTPRSVAGDPALRHLLVAVSHGASADHYQIFVGLRRELPDRLEHAKIGTLDDGRARLRRAARPRADPDPAAGHRGQRDHRLAALPARAGRRDRHQPGQPGADRGAEQHQPGLRRGIASSRCSAGSSPAPTPTWRSTSALTQLGSAAHRRAVRLGRDADWTA